MALESKNSAYSSEDVGPEKTFEFRKFISFEGKRVSAWHDIPLNGPSGGYHAVIEITRKTKAKMEIVLTEENNPIKQDVKKGKLRDYNIPIQWNYGAIPQTWEQPDHSWPGLEGHQGDNDPVDIVDLSQIDVPCGTVIEVKPICVLAMIDEGEVDWKVIGINTADPLAAKINSLADAEVIFPGEVTKVREWFEWYKAVDGDGNRLPDKEPNVFGFGGAPLDTEAAQTVVEEAHRSWVTLITRQVP